MQQARARFQSFPLLFCAYMPNATPTPSGLAKTAPLALVVKIAKNPSLLTLKGI